MKAVGWCGPTALSTSGAWVVRNRGGSFPDAGRIAKTVGGAWKCLPENSTWPSSIAWRSTSKYSQNTAFLAAMSIPKRSNS